MLRLTQEQIDRFADQVGDRLAWLGRVRERLERRGCTPNDPLYAAVVKAYNAVHELRVHSLYMREDEKEGPSISMAKQIGATKNPDQVRG